MGWLDQKVALVTGGGNGLGRAIVERFLEEGAKVAILDKSEALLNSLQEEFGKRIHTTLGDVRLLDDNYRAVSETVSKFGGLDIFVGNAGIWDWRVPLVDIPDDKIDAAFDEIMGVNVKGYLFGVKAALPELVRSKGTVILTVSNAGYYVDGGGPLYTASKHAVVGLVRQLAHELAPHVRVNGVAPGALATDLRGAASLGQQDQSLSSVPFSEICRDLYPLRRLPTAREYTGSYVLLASAENSGSTTGIVINCDGGIGVRGFMNAAGGDELPQRLNLVK
jgi:cis-2,3-dihydrobiphenyl-2,3-diol dehydrogenase